jgi:putative flavoprotein involved in K+ transport
VNGVQEGKPVLEDGRVLDVQNVIWSTGSIRLHLGTRAGVRRARASAPQARRRRGPGLYFVGLHFLYAMSSSMIHGVGRDAKYVASGSPAAEDGPAPEVGMVSAA